MTTIINFKKLPTSITIDNLSYPYTYIGRTMKSLGIYQGSIFANPFKLEHEKDRVVILEKYRQWLAHSIINGDISISQLMELSDRILVCFCKPKQCHGDILIEFINAVKTDTLNEILEEYKRC